MLQRPASDLLILPTSQGPEAEKDRPKKKKTSSISQANPSTPSAIDLDQSKRWWWSDKMTRSSHPRADDGVTDGASTFQPRLVILARQAIISDDHRPILAEAAATKSPAQSSTPVIIAPPSASWSSSSSSSSSSPSSSSIHLVQPLTRPDPIKSLSYPLRSPGKSSHPPLPPSQLGYSYYTASPLETCRLKRQQKQQAKAEQQRLTTPPSGTSSSLLPPLHRPAPSRRSVSWHPSSEARRPPSQSNTRVDTAAIASLELNRSSSSAKRRSGVTFLDRPTSSSGGEDKLSSRQISSEMMPLHLAAASPPATTKRVLPSSSSSLDNKTTIPSSPFTTSGSLLASFSSSPPSYHRAAPVEVPTRNQTPHPPGFMALAHQQTPPTAMPDNVAGPSSSRGQQPMALPVQQPINQEEPLRDSDSRSPEISRETSSRPSVGSSSGSNTYLTEFGATSGLSGQDATNDGGLQSERRGSKQKRSKKKTLPPELLVIVRPPPSKERNPLNLQIQLVAPTAPRNSSDHPSGGTSESGHGGGNLGIPDLKRRGSTGSSRSGRSGRSEMTTASTSSSTGSGMSGRRVTPLYNLSFHALLPTTVSDAGTDQRVAKFSKKGVELEGFGYLEPRELVVGLNDQATLEANNPAIVAVTAPSTAAAAGPSSTKATSVASPKMLNKTFDSATSTSTSDAPAYFDEPPTSFEAMTPEAQSPETAPVGAKFLKKLKGLNIRGPNSNNGSGSNAAGSSAPPSIAGFFSHLSVGSKAGSSKTGTGSTLIESTPPASVAATGPLSTNRSGPGSDIPQLIAGAGVEGGRRTQGYFWVVKKFSRRVADEDGNVPEAPLGPDGQNLVLSNVWKRFNLVNRLGGSERHPHPARIPIRIEWTRDEAPRRGSVAKSEVSKRGKSAVRSQRGSTSEGEALALARKRLSGLSQSAPDSRRGASIEGDRQQQQSQRLGSNNVLNLPLQSRSPSRRRSGEIEEDLDEEEEEGEEGEDSGYHSDPEDSETPWSCHLVLSGTTRIPIGTLRPAPHHPKLVAQLAVPFPLPDLSTTGLGSDEAGLTREELKDLICVTCLHLTIRESFGGLGRRGSSGNTTGGGGSGGGNPAGGMANGGSMRSGRRV